MIIASLPAAMGCESACVVRTTQELSDAIANVAGWLGWSSWFDSPARLETAVRRAVAVGVLEQDEAVRSAMSMLSAADAERVRGVWHAERAAATERVAAEAKEARRMAEAERAAAEAERASAKAERAAAAADRAAAEAAQRAAQKLKERAAAEAAAAKAAAPARTVETWFTSPQFGGTVVVLLVSLACWSVFSEKRRKEQNRLDAEHRAEVARQNLATWEGANAAEAGDSGRAPQPPSRSVSSPAQGANLKSTATQPDLKEKSTSKDILLDELRAQRVKRREAEARKYSAQRATAMLHKELHEEDERRRVHEERKKEKEARREAEKAAAQRECQICLESHDCAQGVECAAGGHFVCTANCFHSYVVMELETIESDDRLLELHRENDSGIDAEVVTSAIHGYGVHVQARRGWDKWGPARNN